jgi:hypothetical protein
MIMKVNDQKNLFLIIINLKMSLENQFIYKNKKKSNIFVNFLEEHNGL